MNSGIKYELWNGKEVIGNYYSMFPLRGQFLVVPFLPILKQPYNKKVEEIKVPLITRIVDRTATDITYRWVLDVRRKSKRQIKRLKGHF